MPMAILMIIMLKISNPQAKILSVWAIAYIKRIFFSVRHGVTCYIFKHQHQRTTTADEKSCDLDWTDGYTNQPIYKIW